MPSLVDRIKALQRRLGLRPDGLIGPVTLTRIEAVVDRVLGRPAEPAPGASLVVSKRSLDAIVQHEISSEAFYRQALERPIWPGAESGVTVGIGYDLGHTSAAQVERDWRGRLPDADLDALLHVRGKTGAGAKAALPEVAHVVVPLTAAREVFYTSTLPRFGALVRTAYPGAEALPPDAQGALLSLVFNRGVSMADTDKRREMRAIRDLVPAGDLDGIAGQIRAMKRHWDAARLGGLHRRRDAEADLVAGAARPYDADEHVSV